MYFDNVSCFSFATRFTHLQNILLSQCFLRLRNKTYNTWFPWQPGIFWDGTITKINQWMKLYMYANFHACIQKCTILALIRRTNAGTRDMMNNASIWLYDWPISTYSPLFTRRVQVKKRTLFVYTRLGFES